MDGSKPEPDALRRELHLLLQDRPDGLTDADVAFGLNLSRSEAQELLEQEQREGLVREEYQAEPEPRTLWYTRTSIRPAVPPAVPVAAPRSQHPIAWGAGLLLLALVVLVVVLRGPDPDTNTAGADPNPPVVRQVPVVVPPTTSEERVEAELAGSQRDRWEAELRELRGYIAFLEEAASTGGCEAVWAGGEDCYAGGRLLSRAGFQEERSRMQLRAAELESLLTTAAGSSR
jgi:hypothetical protein